MLRVLLAKDLRRVRRNPMPWVISLVIPFFITAFIGYFFGPRSGGGGGLGTIRIAVVDEDDTGLTEFLRGFMEQARTGGGPAEKPPFDIQAEFLTRVEAEHRIRENEIAAAMVIPKGFTDGFLDEMGRTSLELIKNPARAIHPRVVEEMLGLLVAAMNAVKDLAGDQFPAIRRLVQSDDEWLTKLAIAGGMLVEARGRLEPVQAYLAPPLVTFKEVEREEETAAVGQTGQPTAGDVFGYVLAGMAAMFLLYLADHPMRDLYRETRWQTLTRFKTLHEGLFVFIGGKVLFAVVAIVAGAVILFGLGGLVFQIEWREPLPVAVLVLAYAFCGAGIMGLLAALAGTERRTDILSNVFIMGAALAGGCMFPIGIFPAFMRDYITPLMPTGWFAGTVRLLQEGGGAPETWMLAAGKLVALGLVATVLSAAIFRWRLEKGVRA